MSQPKPVVLKIGGSAITDKNGELAARTQVMSRLAEEIEAARVPNLVVVHGGGSFGHPPAQKYAIKEGFKEENQKIGFAETHHMMTVLSGLFMDALIWRGIPAVSVAPCSCVTTENGRIRSFEDCSLRKLLKMGFLPVLYGDAVLDTKLGFTILSGDQLVAALAVELGAERIIIGVDVDGLYESDPKVDKTAKILARVTLAELSRFRSSLGKSVSKDVTGGMHAKMAELIPAVERGISVTMVNALEPNNIRYALKGEKVKGTVIEKE